MLGTVETRLAEKGFELPKAASPAANYVSYIITDSLVYVSGQITSLNGELKFIGRLGENLDVEKGYQAAQLCGLNLIAQVKEACIGDLERVKKVIRLGGFVNSSPDFSEHPKVINGASDLMVSAFGPTIGQHSRFAVGVTSLPLGVAVEVDATFKIHEADTRN